MTKIIELNIEIDTDEKILYIGEDHSSGVEERYENINDISKYIKEYLDDYHKKEIEYSMNEIELIE